MTKTIFTLIASTLLQLYPQLEAQNTAPLQPLQWEHTSPFTEVTLAKDRISVTYRDRFYQLISVNGFAVEELMFVSQRVFGSQWEEQLIEDLPLVLEEFGCSPSKTVALEMRDVLSNKNIVVEKAKMSSDNYRKLIERRTEYQVFPSS